MGRYNDVATADVQYEIVRSSSARNLERDANGAIGNIAAGRAITGLWLAGAGDGAAFTLTIEHAVAAGLAPASTDLLFYGAETPSEQSRQRAGAESRATSGYTLRDTETAGASKGLVIMGLLVFVDPDAGEYNPALDQSDWYINAITGDDANDGATSSTALATAAELRRRLGDDPLIDNTTVNVWIESDLAEVVRLSARFNGTAAIIINGGVKTVLVTDTITGWTSFAVGSEPAIQGTSIADFTPYRGKRFTILDGTEAGKRGFIGGLAVFGGGNDNWHHGILSYENTAYAPAEARRYTTSTNAPSNGDQFQIEDLFEVDGLELSATWTAVGPNSTGFIVRSLALDAPNFQDTIASLVSNLSQWGRGEEGRGQAVMFESIVETFVTGSGVNLVGCACGRQDGNLGQMNAENLWNLRIEGLVGRNLNFFSSIVSECFYLLCDEGSVAFYNTQVGRRSGVDIGLWNTVPVAGGILVLPDSLIWMNNAWGNLSNGGSVGWDVEGRVYTPAIANISTLVVAGTDVNLGGAATAYGALPAVNPANNAFVAINP